MFYHTPWEKGNLLENGQDKSEILRSGAQALSKMEMKPKESSLAKEREGGV